MKFFFLNFKIFLLIKILSILSIVIELRYLKKIIKAYCFDFNNNYGKINKNYNLTFFENINKNKKKINIALYTLGIKNGGRARITALLTIY